jgi:hypothetical protein
MSGFSPRSTCRPPVRGVQCPPMLITCAVSSIADLLKPKGRAKPKLDLDDVPSTSARSWASTA